MKWILLLGLLVPIVAWRWAKRVSRKRAWEMNRLIRDAIIMGVADKHIAEEKLHDNDFGLQLFGRAINWAIPNIMYTFERDVATVEDVEMRRRLLINDGEEVFRKGLNLLNADPDLERLAGYNIALQCTLVRMVLSPAKAERKYPGLVRMRRYLFQSSEKEPDVKASDFCERYMALFVIFNDKYGKYGKTLQPETIAAMFRTLRAVLPNRGV
jgi:hypothetical protein